MLRYFLKNSKYKKRYLYKNEDVMTVFYICKSKGLKELKISQSQNQKLACDITKAAIFFDEIKEKLIAIDVEAVEVSFANLKDLALYSMELTQDGIELWQDHGVKIYEYLFPSEDESSLLLDAYSNLSMEISEYESLCSESSEFEDLGVGLGEYMETKLDDNIREEQGGYVTILWDFYKIKDLRQH